MPWRAGGAVPFPLSNGAALCTLRAAAGRCPGGAAVHSDFLRGGEQSAAV